MSSLLCPLCNGIDFELQQDGRRDIYHVKCAVCGRFAITDEAISMIQAQPQLKARRYLLSGVTRNASESGKRIEITSYTIAELIEQAPVPRSPVDVLEKLLPLIADRSPEFAQPGAIGLKEYPRFYLKSADELGGVLQTGVELGYGTLGGGDPAFEFWLNAKGWDRVRQIRERLPVTRQAFVAMSFAAELNDAYTGGIRPALLATGYQPLRVDEVQHNDKIDDRIVAELRRSGLLVADFTLHRNGVYFEAGYALGRGLPVIWCCRKDNIDNAHFDTRQFNHITWESPEQLREGLEARIRATLRTFPAIQT